MRDQQLRVLQGTTVDVQALDGPVDVWGVIVEGTTTAAAAVDLHDNVSTTLTVLVTVSTVTAGSGTAFQKMTSVMFPRPVRFSKALSVNMTATERFFIYVTGTRVQ